MTDDELNKIIKDNELNKINDKVYLTNYQIEVLEKNNIPFQNCQDLQELLIYLEDIIDDEELDEIADEISEFSYYHFTNK